MEDLLDDSTDNNATQKRPQFLSVLCVLTWVGAGFSVLYGIWGIFMFKMIGNFSNAITKPNQNSLPRPNEFDQSLEVFDWLFWLSVYSIFASLLCILGAIWMWNLRKKGFFLYVFAELTPSILTILIYIGFLGVNNSQGTGAMIGFFGFLWMLIPVGFVIMYGVNYRFLK